MGKEAPLQMPFLSVSTNTLSPSLQSSSVQNLVWQFSIWLLTSVSVVWRMEPRLVLEQHMGSAGGGRVPVDRQQMERLLFLIKYLFSAIVGGSQWVFAKSCGGDDCGVKMDLLTLCCVP